MYINEVRIKNYRCFENFSVRLNQFTLIVGENNAGKSNFIKALSLPLTMGSLDFSQKRLSIADFNSACVERFLKNAYAYYRLTPEEQLKDENSKYLKDLTPVIEIELSFTDPKDNYELSLIHTFLGEEDKKTRV